MIKTLHEKARIGFMLVIVLSVFYAVAWAGLNRITGPTVTPGWGIRADGDSTEVNAFQCADSLMGIWDIDQIINGEKTFSGDSVIVSTGGFRAMAADFYGLVSPKAGLTVTGTVTLDANEIGNTEVADIESTWIADGGIGATDLGTNAVGNAQCEQLDSTWITDGAIGGGNIKTSEIYSSHIVDGTIGAEDIGTGAVGDDEIDYANVTLADFDYQTAWQIFYTDVAGDVTELALGADGTYLKSNGAAAAPTWATPPGGDPGAAINDSIWSSKPIKGVNYSHPIDYEDSVATYRFAMEGTYFGINILYNFSTATDDQTDSTWFDVLMPSESPDLDSFVIPAYYTSADNVDSAGITVVIFKKIEPLGDTTRIYTGSALKTNSAWAHLAIAGASINAIAGGDRLISLIVSKIDKPDSVKYKDPVPYAPQT